MRPRLVPPAALILVASLVLAGLSGCSTMHSWVQASSNHPATAGASVSVPFGK